jgi:hypothetical protein
MLLNRHEQGIVVHLAELKLVSVLMTFFGLVGVLYCLYSVLYGHNRPSEVPLVQALTLFLFAISVQGWLLTSAYKVIGKLSNELKNRGEQDPDRT